MNINDRLVTIIIPVYNSEKYLQQCIESLQKQTYACLEIICVDDESEDRSVQMLKEMAQEDERIRVFTTPHMGAGEARNYGMKQANGEFLMFLDSDDFFSPELVEKTVRKASETDADIVLFDSYNYDDTTGESTSIQWAFSFPGIWEYEVFSGEDFPDDIMQVSNTVPWTKLYKREFVCEQKLVFQNIHNSNDILFVMLSLCLAQKIAYVNERLVWYRVGITGNLQTNKRRSPMSFLEAIEGLYDELHKRKIYEKYKRSFNYRALQTIWDNVRALERIPTIADVYRELERVAFAKMDLTEDLKDPRTVGFIEYLNGTRIVLWQIDRLEGEKRAVQNELEKRQAELEKEKAELEQARSKCEQLEKTLQITEVSLQSNKEKLQEILNSKTFMVGRIILFVPSRIHDYFKGNRP